MQCYFCGGPHPQHDNCCPEGAAPSQQEAAKATWKTGYEDGSHRCEAQSDDPTYKLGWVKGDAYADTRENVFE